MARWPLGDARSPTSTTPRPFSSKTEYPFERYLKRGGRGGRLSKASTESGTHFRGRARRIGATAPSTALDPAFPGWALNYVRASRLIPARAASFLLQLPPHRVEGACEGLVAHLLGASVRKDLADDLDDLARFDGLGEEVLDLGVVDGLDGEFEV